MELREFVKLPKQFTIISRKILLRKIPYNKHVKLRIYKYQLVFIYFKRLNNSIHILI